MKTQIFSFLQVVVFLCTINFSTLGNAPQKTNSLWKVIELEDSTVFKDFHNNLTAFVEKWEQNKIKNEYKYLRKLFYAVQEEFLGTYYKSATFEQTMAFGDYNCVSGTMLYSYVLMELGYNLDIIETNYHVYLKVQLPGGGEVMIEPTDKKHGVIIGSEYIEQAENAYKTWNTPVNTKSKKYYKYQQDIFGKITFKELLGLHLFNKAVQAYNAGNNGLAQVYLNTTSQYSQSSRLAELELLNKNSHP